MTLLTTKPKLSKQDQFGFYQVGDQKTYSKIEAIELGKKLKKFPNWNFNDQAFAEADWTTEPTGSLDDLYIQRAWEIRNRYDYLVIWYSGGADSFNMLNTFLKHDIPVDEIAHCWSLKGAGTVETLFNEEIAKVAIPHVQSICQRFPHIKHRVVDQSDSIAQLFTGDVKHDFIYLSNNNFSPNGLDRSFLRENIDDYQNLMNQGKSIGFLWGTDKPRISYDCVQDQYYCQFIDIVDNILSPRTQILARPWEHDELFYWSPEAAKILIKQCHIVQRFLRGANADYDNEVWFSRSNPYKFGYSKILDKHLTQHGLHLLIYPDWEIDTFQRMKTKSVVYGDRDTWFFKTGDATTSKFFQNGVERIRELMTEENIFNMSFLNDDAEITKGIKNFLSPRYYLS